MIKSMTVNELREKLDSHEDLILIDCREQEEWDEAHINGAVFIPLSNFMEAGKEILAGKEEAQIIIQCRSGKRSLQACQMLMQEDYENLSNLEGGILEWVNQGYEVENDQ